MLVSSTKKNKQKFIYVFVIAGVKNNTYILKRFNNVFNCTKQILKLGFMLINFKKLMFKNV